MSNSGFLLNVGNIQSSLPAFNNSYNFGGLGGNMNTTVPTGKYAGLSQGTANNLGIAGSAISGIASLGNMIGGLYSAITSADQAKKQYALAKEQFQLEKDAMNRNVENQGKLINAQVANTANLAGLYGGQGNYSKVAGNYMNQYGVNESALGLAKDLSKYGNN